MAQKSTIKVAKRQVNNVQAYQQLFTSEMGKQVLKDLMKHHYLLDHTMAGENTHEMAFREGHRFP